jgi:hypothetical protein
VVVMYEGEEAEATSEKDLWISLCQAQGDRRTHGTRTHARRHTQRAEAAPERGGRSVNVLCRTADRAMISRAEAATAKRPRPNGSTGGAKQASGLAQRKFLDYTHRVGRRPPSTLTILPSSSPHPSPQDQ